MSGERPGSQATAIVFTAGTVVSVACFVAAFVLRELGYAWPADALSIVAIGALLTTPALGLVASSVELHRSQPSAALLALVVLAILAAAVLLALLGLR
jgi:Na+/melibiose symporter-like transporter